MPNNGPAPEGPKPPASPAPPPKRYGGLYTQANVKPRGAIERNPYVVTPGVYGKEPWDAFDEAFGLGKYAPKKSILVRIRDVFRSLWS